MVIRKTQIQQSLQKAKEFRGKLKNSSLGQQAQWKAVESVAELAIMYPLVNTFYTTSDIKPIEPIISQLRCSALDLNMHFTPVILYGPTALGRLGLSSPIHKNIRH